VTATVHSILPPRLAEAVESVLPGHVAHGDRDPVGAAERAAADPQALALIGPFRSHDVAEALEVTAPAGLALLAPVATWAGVTRSDEPGCDDAADHRGTVLRMLARDTVVTARVAADIRSRGGRALVFAGDHDYGRQLDGQLGLAGLPRVDSEADADVVVLCGLAGAPETARAGALVDLPLIAFDGVQGDEELGRREEVVLALPFAPVDGVPADELFLGVENARRAARLVAGALDDGAADRPSVLARLRELGPFDAFGDPLDPPVWLWSAEHGWALEPARPLP
jgi:hypothetical protein